MSDKPYWEKLKDPRWQKRRLQIMSRANFSCELCGSKTTTLNVHHKLYRKNADPWDYPDEHLACLCERCHKTEHFIRDRLKEVVAKLDLSSLVAVIGFAEGLEAAAAYDGGSISERAKRTWKMCGPEHACGFLAALRWEDNLEELDAIKDASISVDDAHRLATR